MCGTCWEDGLQVTMCAPSPSPNKPYYRNGHYCHNRRSTTPLPACLAVVKHAFQLEGIIPVISVWFPLHILPANLGCRATTADFTKIPSKFLPGIPFGLFESEEREEAIEEYSHFSLKHSIPEKVEDDALGDN
ncbi:hypothetical protein AVEN_77372-1 [Araneus ventricosus]|uniref:Uncharacterized protein n=1 Tax=Araneus ventricosus TaxID=182803 RepID=A0A4Y2C9M8_ARAVE|nr:hypothetical protein AVEN_77372-1 [Araneus ventricosus]